MLVRSRGLIGRPIVALSQRVSAIIETRGIVHQSQKSAANAFVNWEELGLTHPVTVTIDPKVVIKSSMWTPPPHSAAVPAGLPFAVSRTEEGKALPVYSDYKGGGTKVITIIRRIRGDVFAMQSDMSKVCDGKEVIIRPGKLVVEGNYHARCKMWLAGLGF
jgi:hypothetical protein